MKKKGFILAVTMLALLILPLASSIPPISFAAAEVILDGELVNRSATFASAPGDSFSTSGWKPNVPVANGPNTDIHPSMGTFIDPGSGAVTLYAAYLSWHVNTTWGDRYELHVARSLNQGASWGSWGHFWWSGAWTMTYESLVVNAYDNNVFIAFESYPSAGGNHRIDCLRINSSGWEAHPIDTTDDNRIPSLTIEYSYATNWMYVSYEKWTDTDDRDLYVGKSTDWGVTWNSQLLRGGASDTDVYAFSDTAYAQGNVYIAYRHSQNWSTTGHIDVSYSTNYGVSWNHVENVSQVPNDASFPTIAGARAGTWHQPTAVIVAYDYATTPTNHDILYTWTKDYGATWTGGNGTLNQIAASADLERMPQLAVDGMGTESVNVGGNFHLVYWKGFDAYYTQLQYWDLPVMLGVEPWGYYLGWSKPHGLINDAAGEVPLFAEEISITTYIKPVGGVDIWEPGVTWTDGRNPSYDLYYTTPGTDFSITVAPSSQTVVAGTSAYYSLTVNLLSATAAPAYLSGTHWPWVILGTNFALGEYSASPITPTDTCTLTVATSNLMPAGDYYLNATATVGGYRRIVAVNFTVINPPTLEMLDVATWYWTSNTTINSVAVGDVDGDGLKETVTGGSFHDGTRNVAQLVVWDSLSLSVEQLATWYWTGDTVINSVAIGDVDGDGQVEIVTGGSYFDGARNVAQLVVWSGSTLAAEGIRTWYWTSNTVINSVALGDVDADGQTEIVTGGYFNDGTRNRAQLVVWSGSTLAAERLTDWYWTGNTVINSVAIGDVDADAQVEIVTGGYHNDGARNVAQLVVWTGSSLAVDRVTTWYWTGDTAVNSVALGDVDDDGQTEIVTGGYFNNGAGNAGQLVVWGGSTLAVKRVSCLGRSVINSVALADVEGDGQVEVVTGGQYDDGARKEAQLIVWSGSSLAVEDARTWYWVSDAVINSLCIGDIGGDASKEILIGGAHYDGLRWIAQLIVWSV